MDTSAVDTEEGNTASEIEAMAEKTVAELEADTVGGTMPMETETTTAPAPATEESSNVVAQTETTLTVAQPGQPTVAGTITVSNVPPPAETMPSPSKLEKVMKADDDETVSSEEDATDGRTPRSAKSKDGRKRKTTRTVRRVLIAKKEHEAATQTMTGLRDIASVLDPVDATFLAENYWVFTQQQLAWLIDSVSPPKDGDEMEVEPLVEESKAAPEEEKAPEGDAKTGEKDSEVEETQETPQKSSWQERRDMLLASMAANLKFDSAKVVKAELSDESGEAKTISIASREDAEKRLHEWSITLKTIEGRPFLVEEQGFRLDGPMKFLIPQGFKNFLDSIEIKTLFQFLALKKTETGALCELYALWRHTCSLSRVTAPAVVRYFLGIHSRLEGAVTSVPPCDEHKRKWMNKTIVVMTGAALEFLVEDRGIYTARDFVDARTKDLSLQLAAWRERKNLEPLKGSGKVAMISGWKAVAKEIVVIESGDGKVVPNLRELASSDLVLDDEPRAKRTRSSDVKKEAPVAVETPVAMKAEPEDPPTPPVAVAADAARRRSGARNADYDLHSKLFLEQVLGVDVTEFLALASIHTAAQLFEAEESNGTLLQAMVDAEEAKNIESAAVILKAWTTKLKNLLAAPTPKIKKGRPQGKAIKPEILKDASDPYDLMSDVTKTFLSTMDIHTAEEFLTTRTTEIAAEFVKFRKKNGMSELKGLGSIASVSGWKANCRRFARAMGREDIAVLEPVEKTTSAPRTTPMKAAILQQQGQETPSAASVTHQDVLYGKSRRMFAVQGEADIPIQFRFDVSLRSEESGSGIGLYLTYKGSGPSIRPASVLRVNLAGSDDSLPILVDTTLTKSGDSKVDGRAPFSSYRKGCGLIDLQKYGVRPLKDQDLGSIQSLLRNFLANVPLEKLPKPAHSEAYNIAVRRSDVDKCQYLAVVSSPMQAGQTMPLFFPTIEMYIDSGLEKSGNFLERDILLSSMYLTSKSDLSKILDVIIHEILPSATLESDDVTMLKTSIKTRQRIDWISRRIFAQLSTDDDAELKSKLTFSFAELKVSPPIAALPDESFDDVVHCIQEELSESFASLIEYDCILGDEQRNRWCPLAKEIYDEVVGTVLSSAIVNRAQESVDYKGILEATFKRVTDLSLDANIIPKLAFVHSPLNESDESKGPVVICASQGSKESKSSDLETFAYTAIPLEEVEKADTSAGVSFYNTTPDVSFYRTYLIKIAVKVLMVFGKIMDAKDFDADAIIDSWKLGEVLSPESRASIVVPWQMPADIPSQPAASIQPETEQFFLGIVWPVLREFGWRIEVNDFPRGRVFVAPKWKGDHQKLGKLAKIAKTHRDRRRLKMAKEVNQIGFGALPKLTKRLFVASGGLSKDVDGLGKPASGRKIATVEKICEEFLEHVKVSSQEKNPEVLDRAAQIVEQVIECFDSLAPMIHSSTLSKASKRFGGDVFMEFLLVLPALLQSAGVSLGEMNDSLELVHELTEFMTFKYADIFPASLKPPQEIYMTKGKQVPSTLMSRLRRKTPSESKSASDELTEVLWEEDTSELTDFVVNVMSQTVACRATEADVTRKFRRIHIGYPGVVCRHCMGEGGEGRYFFTTIESLTTLGTVFEKHLVKCAYVPADIRKSVVASRAKHAEQRKAFPNGAQQAYFNRLWDRLRSMKISGTTSSSSVPLAVGPALGESAEAPSELGTSSDEKMSFTESAAILDFLRTVTPWKGTKEIEEALNQYYNCLDYGGRIYQTRSMPEHFSPAWLLNKVVPRKRAPIKRNMPG